MGTHQHDPHRENEGASEDDLDVFKPAGSPITIERRIAHAAEFSARQLARIAKAIDREPADSLLLEIRDQLTTIKQEIHAMTALLQELKAEVAANRDGTKSAIALLEGLTKLIQDSIDDPAEIQAILDAVKTDTAELGAAVTANTPAAPGGSPRPK